jgi:hypothetical protein
MFLQPPKKNPATGVYNLALNPPIKAPRLTYDGSTWTLTAEWESWATDMRKHLMGDLLSHGTWFSRPPRRDVLEPLFAPWTGRATAATEVAIFCKGPEGVPGPGTAICTLEGLAMTATAITPVWRLGDFVAAPDNDTISIFGDGDTVEGSDDGEETREILFDDIEPASPAATEPTRIRNRDWEARKFLAKERVREARLKAQIADRMAAKEESRFYSNYGELSDNESQFSEYDLTDDEEEEDSESAPSQP